MCIRRARRAVGWGDRIMRSIGDSAKRGIRPSIKVFPLDDFIDEVLPV